MQVLRPVIFTYHDYRTFLKDMVVYLKEKNKLFNMNALGKKLGVTPSYLSMILNRKRDLNPELVEQVTDACELSAKEASFFELLFSFNVSKGDVSQSKVFEKMKQFKQYKELNPKEAELHSYMSNWLNVVVREMTALEDFCEDPKWIQSRIKYPTKLQEIKETLDFLMGASIIEKGENGKFKKPDKQISCMDKVYRNALIQFHRGFLKLAGDSTVYSKASERELLGHCVCLEDENILKAKKILNEAFEKVRELQTSSNNGKHVYFIELALFPLTQGVSDEIKEKS